MSEYFATVYQRATNTTKNVKTRDINSLFTECLTGFANSYTSNDMGEPMFRVALICTKYKESANSMYIELCRAFAPQAYDESYVPSLTVESFSLPDNIKTDFANFVEINIEGKKRQYIRRTKRLCIGHLHSDSINDAEAGIKDIVRLHIFLPLLLSLVPSKTINQSFIECVNDTLAALEESSDRFLSSSLRHCFDWVNQQSEAAINMYRAATTEDEKKSIASVIGAFEAFPRNYRFILSIPFDMFDRACASSLPYIDRVIRIETDDSLLRRYNDKKEIDNINVTFNEFVTYEYPNLIIYPNLDKNNQENPKTISHAK